MSSISTRYAPIHCSHIPPFPNRIPNVDGKTYLPKFKYQKSDDASLHLVKFHMYIHKLGVEFHEDSLIKMFMASLEGNVQSRYERFPSGSLYSLEDFHTICHEHFKEQYPSLFLVEYCCMHVKGFIQNFENVYGDD